MTSSPEKSPEVDCGKQMKAGTLKEEGGPAQKAQSDLGEAASPNTTGFSARQAVSSIYRRLINHLNSEEETESKFRSCNEFTI